MTCIKACERRTRGMFEERHTNRGSVASHPEGKGKGSTTYTFKVVGVWNGEVGGKGSTKTTVRGQPALPPLIGATRAHTGHERYDILRFIIMGVQYASVV